MDTNETTAVRKTKVMVDERMACGGDQALFTLPKRENGVVSQLNAETRFTKQSASIRAVDNRYDRIRRRWFQ